MRNEPTPRVLLRRKINSLERQLRQAQEDWTAVEHLSPDEADSELRIRVLLRKYGIMLNEISKQLTTEEVSRLFKRAIEVGDELRDARLDRQLSRVMSK